MMRIAACVFSIGLAVVIAEPVCAQDYPTKPIRLVTGAAAGGADFAARMIAQSLSERLGQQLVVDNRGNGIIPAEIVSRSQPDGYTLLVNGSNIWLLPFLQNNVPYDPVKDFSPITMAIRSPGIVVVYPSLPVKSIQDLIALAKAKPGQLNYASGPTGGANHLGPELFKSMAGVNIVRVPYKGVAAALTDVIGGQVQLMFANATAVPSHLKAGRLRALAVTSAEPSALFPDLPTVASAGLPGFESATSVAVFAPPRTANTLINRLNNEISNALNRADIKEKILNSGSDVVCSSPAQLGATMKAEMARMGKVISDAGIRGE